MEERAVEHFENTVILTTHIAREVEQLCDRIATLNRGMITYVGPVETLGRSPNDFLLDSYRSLFMEHRRAHGLPATDMLFDEA